MEAVDYEEFIQAIKLIKTDKATSIDCTSDFIIRLILSIEQDPGNQEVRTFGLNFLAVINDCLINRKIPNMA